MTKALTIAVFAVVTALTGSGFGDGSSQAESAVRDMFGKTDQFGSLESVSCKESKTPEPPKLVFYDCQVTTSKIGEAT